MTREQVHQNIVKIFRQIFDDDTLEIADETTADDIEAWDSYEQINLLIAIEDTFGIEIPLKRVNQMKNVGEMIDFIYGSGVK